MADTYEPPIEIGRIFGRAWRGMTANARDILLGAAIMTLALTALSWLQMVPFLDGDQFNAMSAQSAQGYWIIAIAVMVMTYLMYSAWWVFVDRLSFRTSTEREVPTKAAVVTGLKLMVPILVISMIALFVMLLGYQFLIVPGVFISICWAVYAPAYISEDKDRAFQITRAILEFNGRASHESLGDRADHVRDPDRNLER